MQVIRQDNTIHVDGLKLPASVFLPEISPGPALCLCHGIPAGTYNPTDEGYTLLAQRFAAAGFVTMIFNFRGAGEAEGNLDMAGWARDLQAAIDYLYELDESDTSRLFLAGSSAGAAISVYAAAHDTRVAALVTFACAADFGFLANEQHAMSSIDHFRSIGLIKNPDFPPSVEEWLQGFSDVSPIRWVERISPRPLLLLHGDQDDIVPLEHAHRLLERAGEPKQLLVLQGAGHRLRVEEIAITTALEWLRAKASLTSI
jgi:dipeptidyl aminopeptidase/acylaminoacyl peptidase